MDNMINNFSDTLIASELNPLISTEDDLFGKFIGKWDFKLKYYSLNKTSHEYVGSWIFERVLNGLAIQDLWVIPSLEGKGFHEYGTSLRSFDLKTKKWKVTWVGPMQNQYFVFDVERINKEIHLKLISQNDPKMRWVFYEIAPNEFQWRSEVFLTEESKWFMNCHMSLTKSDNVD